MRNSATWSISQQERLQEKKQEKVHREAALHSAEGTLLPGAWGPCRTLASLCSAGSPIPAPGRQSPWQAAQADSSLLRSSALLTRCTCASSRALRPAWTFCGSETELKLKTPCDTRGGHVTQMPHLDKRLSSINKSAALQLSHARNPQSGGGGQSWEAVCIPTSPSPKSQVILA